MKWIGKIFFLLAIGFSIFFFQKYGQHKTTFHSDSLGYYSYLPAYFNLDNFDSICRLPRDGTVPGQVCNQLDNYARLRVLSDKGYVMFPYTYGVSLFGSPFYLMAEGYHTVNNIKSTGYSDVHNSMMQLSTIFYALLGLFFTFLILRRLFNSDLALLTVSLILLATNLFWFTTLHFGMSHPILFFLVALLIYQTIYFYEKPTRLKMALIFLTVGLLTIVRATDILFALIPILYGVGSWKEFKNRLLFFKERWVQMVLCVPLFILPLVPQLLYWKKYAGSWYYYTHGDESFNFLKPNILKGLFGPDNGWLLYSPIWILAVVMLFARRNKQKGFKTVLLILVPLYIYIIYSWWCYQYINGFGSRPMIHLYALLAIPLAGFIQEAFKRKWTIAPLLILFSFLSYHNMHFSYLNDCRKYWSEFSNYEFHWNMMFKNNLSYNDLVVRDSRIFQPKVNSVEKVKDLAFYSSKQDTLFNHRYDSILNDSVIVIPEGEESPALKLNATVGQLSSNEKYFVKASCVSYFTQSISDSYSSLLMVHKFATSEKDISWNAINLYTKSGLPNDRDLAVDSIWINRGTPKIWDTLSFYIPIKNKDKDLVSKLDFWNMPKIEFYLHRVKLELYRKK